MLSPLSVFSGAGEMDIGVRQSAKHGSLNDERG